MLLLACGGESPATTETQAPEIEPTPEPKRSAEFTELEDDVQARASETDEYTQADVGLSLVIGGQARTGEPGRARLDLLPDKSIVRVGPSSRFTLVELDQELTDPVSRFKLFSGQIWIILSGGSLEIETPNGVAGVRGSMLGVNFDPAKMSMSATCLEGMCKLSNTAGSADLTAGEAADILVPDEAPTEARPFTTNETLGWLWNVPESTPLLDPPIETVQIEKENGNKLAGTFYFNQRPTNWIVVLDPMIVGSQGDFIENGLLFWLLGIPGSLDEIWGFPLHSDLTFNVLTYDPISQGQSDGTPGTFNQKGWRDDASTVAIYTRDYLGYYDAVYNPQPTCAVYVGGSTGGDRAMLSCAASPESCAGVISLSPGGYLGPPFQTEYDSYQAGSWMEYSQAGDFSSACPGLNPERGASIYCIASKKDSHSADACKSTSGDNYMTKILPGSGHGTSYFSNPDPEVTFLFAEIFHSALLGIGNVTP